MDSKKHRLLKNFRCRRMLLMVDNTVPIADTDEDLETNCPEITPQASTSTSTYIQSLSQDKDDGCNSVISQISGTSNNLSKHYKLRDVPKKNYVDAERELFDEDFSPDCSEYVPSPERNKSPFSSISSLSGDSQCINRMIANPEITGSPSTISNLSLYLTNINFVASPSVIYRADSILSPVIKPKFETEKQSNPSFQISRKDDKEDINNSLIVISSKLNHSLTNYSTTDPNETLKPENHDITLNGHTPGNCLHDEELVSDREDIIEVVRNLTIDINDEEVISNYEDRVEIERNFNYIEKNIDDCTNESNLENQQESISEEEKKLSRKRKQNRSEWRCKKNKVLKNSGQAYEGCNSKKKYSKKAIGPICTCKKGCGQKFSPSERQDIFDKFYSLADREHQWLFISRHVQSNTIKRMTIERKNNRTQTLNYFFPLNNENITVCKTFFLNTLQIGEQMVYTAIEKVIKADEGLKDKRGKHDNRPNKMNTTTEASIKAHIELFPKVESHYTRKSSKREYLSEYLNISKMYRFYTVWFAEQDYTDVTMATKRQYETVFNSQYNYSFFKPKKDQCPSCSIYLHADVTVKTTLEEKHRLHLQKKETIRQLKKEEINTADKDNTTIAIFDLQKVLNIPQSDVGTFHYKRKYPCYNFTVFDALHKIGYCYVWHYQIAKRGSTEIGSALLLFFKTEREKGITNFSLYSDGCYGQNKNRYIFALYVYAAKLLGISITHRFFETGHSQNEGDSMHACIEKNLKIKVLYTPDQVYSIILNSKVTGEKYRVKELEQSEVYDLKPLVDSNHWRLDKDGNVIHWADVMEVSVSNLQKNKLFFKYNFEDSYSELDINNPHSTLNRRRGRKRTLDASVGLDNVELKHAYHQPIPISKALHTDLMSLCKSGAIPRSYHPFYESLSYTAVTNENITDTDED